MSNGHAILPNEAYEISPDDGNDWCKRLTYYQTTTGMQQDVKGDWIKVREGRYERIRRLKIKEEGVSNMWEYVKGSEADFEGHGDEWFSIWVDNLSPEKPFAAKEGVKFSSSGRFKLIAQRRKVDTLQSRVNDANLQEALSNGERIRRETWSAVTGEPFDAVQRPKHYAQGDVECIDAIKAATVGKSGIEAVCVANVIKYLWRYEEKNGVEDCRKAQWYLDRLVKELSK